MQSEFIQFITKICTLCAIFSISPTPPLDPGNHHSTLCSYLCLPTNHLWINTEDTTVD